MTQRSVALCCFHTRYSHDTISVNPIWSQARYIQAKLSVHDRSLKVATVIESLEMEMELLCLTGVEDQLQTDVRPTLEILRNAGIKVWPAGRRFMLTLAQETREEERRLQKILVN